MIHMRDINKYYRLGGEKVHALNQVSFDIDDGEYVAIIGPSGSGKSTLMNIIGCLDVQDSGTYCLAGTDTSRYTAKQLARLRSTHIGFIFQGFNLLGRLNALENVELPLIYQGVGRRQRRRQAEEALGSVGLADRMKHRPSQLSGGQQQRVAIARALVAKPHLILADEPTGNLDTATGAEIMGLFEQLHDQGNTIVLITHDPGIAARAQRALRIVDGKIGQSENREGKP
ncbi:MAG: ABC transporter ATP-binding protein [Christensenellales bacterium]|jgi:putative ABC transport system ATP-binding protein